MLDSGDVADLAAFDLRLTQYINVARLTFFGRFLDTGDVSDARVFGRKAGADLGRSRCSGNYILGALGGKLVSLWEIMEKLGRSAYHAVHLIEELNELETKLNGEIKKKCRDCKVSALRTKAIINSVGRQSMTLVDDLSLRASNRIVSKLYFMRAAKPASEVVRLLRDVRETIVHELRWTLFLQVTNDMRVYLNKSRPFGDATACAFGECSEDIDEACKCFAFERYTACVFHLGRVMEQATARLAKRMKVGKPDDDWQGNLKAINKALDAMPYGTKTDRQKRAPYAEAAGFSFQFKEAWRNPTAHPKKTYTREEALDVMNGARTFMDAMARKIFKVKIVPERF